MDQTWNFAKPTADLGFVGLTSRIEYGGGVDAHYLYQDHGCGC
jgi:hypothetical protein